MNNKEKGNLGELIASKYLISQGALILDNNYRIKSGEIDIVAKIEEEVVFVEVKSRCNLNFGYPSESVNKNKIRRITQTANHYILTHNLNDFYIRFDVIEVYFKEKKINHIKNAF